MWQTLAAAAEHMQVSVPTLKRRVRAEVVPSYLEGTGMEARRMVWVDGVTLADVYARLGELEAQLAGLTGDMSQPTIEFPTAAPAPEPARPVAASRGSQTFQPHEQIDHEALLAALEAKLAKEGLSDGEIQRQVGLPIGWLTKARKGERRGPQARRSWGRIAAYIAA